MISLPCRSVSSRFLPPLLARFLPLFRNGRPRADEREAVSAEQAAQIMQSVYRRGDGVIARFILAHAALALVFACCYGTWRITFAVGGAAAAVFLIGSALLPRSLTTRCLAGVVLQVFVLLHVCQMHGLAEMRFFFFTACAMMIVYQDWRCLWPGTLLILGQRFFETPHIDALRLVSYCGIAVGQTVICGGWACVLRQRTLEQAGRAQRDVEHERLRQSLAEAEYRADSDPLTGLFNHRAFHHRLKEEADRAGRDGSSLGVAVIDLNNFKFFNDAYGHLVGDAVLQQVAGALERVRRPGEILARYGGDEFTMLAPNLGPEGEHDLGERLRHCLDDCGFQPEGQETPIPITLSVGVACFPQDGPSRLDTLEMADQRLISAKTGEDEDDAVSERHRAALAASLPGFSMLDALVTAVDNKDRYTLRHSEDVLKYSLDVARGLYLDDTLRDTLKTAALLHDVGKIGVPDSILRKPGTLTDEEYTAIRCHPGLGAVIVGAVPGLEETLGAIRYHHERWDGQGYPEGLHGEATPLLARIVAVADAFSAMTTDRPYRKSMEPERAEAILREGAGSQWDPRCVEAFLRERAANVGERAPSVLEPRRAA